MGGFGFGLISAPGQRAANKGEEVKARALKNPEISVSKCLKSYRLHLLRFSDTFDYISISCIHDLISKLSERCYSE